MNVELKGKLATAVAALPDALRDGPRNWFDRLGARHADALDRLEASDFDMGGLVRMLACSEFAAGVLLRRWEWFLSEAERGEFAQSLKRAELERRFSELQETSIDKNEFMKRIRELRNERLVCILWNDLIAGHGLQRTLESLSDLADCAVAAAIEFARRQMTHRYGELVYDGKRVPLVALAMGKLGGRELNFSSDIDLVFVYSADAMTTGSKPVSAHEFFTRVVRQTASVLEEVTADGFVYRVDTRLRPFGDSGPPVVSLAGFERYLLQHGRSWERYAYIKARPIAPAGDAESMDGMMEDVVRPFVYRRYLDYGVFESLREMKALVAAEVRKRELMDDVKLGPGGIREIEFIVQALQLVRGGSVAGLRTTRLRDALENAVDDHNLTGETAAGLLRAYELLRRVENYLQAWRDQQTHVLPASSVEQERLAYAMRYSSWAELERDLADARRFVSDQFAAIAFRDSGAAAGGADDPGFAALWGRRASEEEWNHSLSACGYDESREVARAVASFAELPSTQRIDTIAAERLRQFMPMLLRLLRDRSKPATTLKRVLGIVDRVLRRSAYLALLNENRVVLERLIELCEASGYLANEVARFPVLLDELIDPRRYLEAPGALEIRADLEQRGAAVDPADSERQVEIMTEFKRATLFRLAVADFNGSISTMKVSDRLTDIAELILSRALALAHADLVARVGVPRYRIDGRQHTAGLGVIAYGKLGGMELSYGSDLDLVFVHDSRGEQQQTDGPKPVDNAVFFGRLARRLVHFLTTQTGSGALYEIDTRLRPSGRSGLIVTSIDAFERYQVENAWTWEHQALLRGRAVAGSSVVAREFERIRAQTLRERVRRDCLKEDVVSMRAKMRAQLDKSDAERFDLKQGSGGIADIEFLVQYLVLLNAASHPAVIHYSDNIRQLGTLAAAGCLSEEESRRLQEIYRRYRALTHRLALDDRPAYVPAESLQEERRFVHDLWLRKLGPVNL